MGRDSIAQGALALGMNSKQHPSPGARSPGPQARCNNTRTSPHWGFTLLTASEPRADSPWAIESRPPGAQSSPSSPRRVDSQQLRRLHETSCGPFRVEWPRPANSGALCVKWRRSCGGQSASRSAGVFIRSTAAIASSTISNCGVSGIMKSIGPEFEKSEWHQAKLITVGRERLSVDR